MASEMLWRRLSDKERKEVEQKAKKIMLEFGKTLEKLPEIPEAIVDREKFEREEGLVDNEKCSADFRDLMFENAPNKNDDCIIAEKGEWTKK
ncbi:MAG: hypothetical protein AABW91_01320 [Nanoarchaeota archaeon]